MLVRYFKKSDNETLNYLFGQRGLSLENKDSLPEIGFVSEYEYSPTYKECSGMIFLRRCEGGLGIVEGLVTNPHLPSAIRHLAFKTLVNRAVEEAKSLKITRMLAYSVIPSVIERSCELGFEEKPHTLLLMEV